MNTTELATYGKKALESSLKNDAKMLSSRCKSYRELTRHKTDYESFSNSGLDEEVMERVEETKQLMALDINGIVNLISYYKQDRQRAMECGLDLTQYDLQFREALKETEGILKIPITFKEIVEGNDI